MVTDRVGPCTATMSSDTSDGGAPLYSPAEPPKVTQSWSSMRLAAAKAREDDRSGAAETVTAHPAGVSAATLSQDKETNEFETRDSPDDLGSLNTASASSLPQTAATKNNCQVSISSIRWEQSRRPSSSKNTCRSILWCWYFPRLTTYLSSLGPGTYGHRRCHQPFACFSQRCSQR